LAPGKTIGFRKRAGRDRNIMRRNPVHELSSTASPAMAAGVINRRWEIGDIVNVLEAWETSKWSP
jgi:hypothetical protein